MASDGHTNIFQADAVDTALYMWSVSGQYERQLLSPQHLKNKHPENLAIDCQRGHVMYVGNSDGTVGVYALAYERV